TMSLSPDQQFMQQQQDRYDKLKRNVAIGCLVVCPLVALLPPRKLDWYTFGLGTAFVVSADHLTTQSTGKGLYQHLLWTPKLPGSELPTERAREVQRALKEKELREQGKDAMRELRREQEEKKQGVLQKLWMGDEKEGWKERRLQEERDALEQGKNYTDMILEQIWEVWNWDKKGADGKVREQAQGVKEGEERK
ncbi:hypothetical protein GQ43DRAFT_367232, partial [Delitschia confertaspora ATCC 74209]